LVLGCLALGLAACVTVPNPLSPDQITSFRLVGTNVGFAPDALIWWGDAEREFAVSKGLSPLASESIANTDEAKAYVRKAAAGKFREALERNVAGRLPGSRPVRLEVLVREIQISSGVQRIVLGGDHRLSADVNLVDAKSGAVLLSYPGQGARLPAGQGILGVAVDNLIIVPLLKDPIDRLVQNYAVQYSDWLLRN
jgi:hypothetical protein